MHEYWIDYGKNKPKHPELNSSIKRQFQPRSTISTACFSSSNSDDSRLGDRRLDESSQTLIKLGERATRTLFPLTFEYQFTFKQSRTRATSFAILPILWSNSIFGIRSYQRPSGVSLEAPRRKVIGSRSHEACFISSG